MKKTIFITGIDTDAGKTYCTAWLARQYLDRGLTVATQKFIQTGNVGHSEDIDAHRRLLGIDPLLMGFGLERDTIHSPNESYLLSQFFAGIRSLALFYKYY